MSDNASLAAVQSHAASPRLADDYELRSASALSGEHRLMLAILADAVLVYVKSFAEGTASPAAREARVWLHSRDRSLPFAFESICDLLGLDSSYIRRGLRTARARPAEVATRLTSRHARSPGPATPPRARHA